MKIRILRLAREDIEDGYWFYEKQTAGLGEYFVESVLADIDSLLLFAGVHAVRFGKYRMVASKFPYSIFYSFEDSEARIYGVVDNRRDPEWISDRLN